MEQLPLPLQELYELLFETSTEGLVIADEAGNILIANARAAELFGYSLGELRKLNVDHLLPKDRREKHKEHRKAYSSNPHKRAMGKGYDLAGRRKDGSQFPLEISLNYYRNQDRMYVLALIMDISDRRAQQEEIQTLNKTLERRVEQRTNELEESQLLYRSIARNFPNGTINVFDRDFNYIFVEGQELYRQGITSQNLMGKNYLEQLPEGVREDLRPKLESVLGGENRSFEIEYQGQHYMINAVPLSHKDSNVNRILLVEQNITERKVYEQKVIESLEKEKQLNELKSRFVSMASHEFRTPLSTVLSSLSLIEKYDEAGLNEKKPKHFERIKSSVRHLTGILNDFLSLEKVETGKVSVQYATLNVKDFIAEMTEQQQQVAKQGQVLQYTHKGSSVVQTDQNMIRIIVSNLLSNAIKYSPANSPISIRSSVEEGELNLSVADRGIGIPLEDQQHMYERFFRAKNAVNLEGTGLGLNIVQRYLELLNGSISFESRPDEGTTFYVSIPLKK